MPTATVTWEDGTVTEEEISTSIADEGTDEFEFILWDDCALTIEHPLYVLTGSSDFDHVRLPRKEVLKLKAFLNSDHVSMILKDTE